jgi:hypothetical protein
MRELTSEADKQCVGSSFVYFVAAVWFLCSVCLIIMKCEFMGVKCACSVLGAVSVIARRKNT